MRTPPALMPVVAETRDDDRMELGDVAMFGETVAGVLADALGADLVGAWFVGSLALGGYVPGESDIDVVAVCEVALPLPLRRQVVGASAACPARGLEFTLYRRDVAGALPEGADFEVNANGGPRMRAAVHLDPAASRGSGTCWTGPPRTDSVP